MRTLEGLTLLPQIAIPHRQEALLRLRRRERAFQKKRHEPRVYKGTSDADRKAILTITYPEFRFQFGYLISTGNVQSVLRKLKGLRKLLGAGYADAFGCNLSDNGPEFARFHEIEG